MSYTVTDDDGVIQVRASIRARAEMGEFAKALARAEEKLPEEPETKDDSK